MPSPTIVEDYVIAALKHGKLEELEDGTIGAFVPEFPGLVAFGADVHECVRNLYAHLEEWIRTVLLQGHDLPIIEGIDLNADVGHILASYHRDTATGHIYGDFFENERALEEAFRHYDEIAELTLHGSS